MASTDLIRQEIKSKISAIQKLNDNPNSLSNDVYNNYKDDLSSTNGVVQKSVNDFTSKLKGGTQNKKDIFSEIIDTVSGVLGVNKEDPTNPKSKPLVQTKILKYSRDSARTTIQSSKQIIIDEIKKSFFGGTGICAANMPLGATNIDISPKAFDFVNLLKVSPDSITGKVMYEGTVDLGLGDIKFNRELYKNFDTTGYTFDTKDGNNLFTLQWNSGTQMYNVGNLNSSIHVGDFVEKYYSTIEYPNVEDVLKNSMQMILQGDGSEPSSFKNGMNDLNRLTTKLCSICGTPHSKAVSPLLNTAAAQLTEDEVDTQSYFDFDDVEGIDMDDENARYRNVLKFVDCNNFEVPMNPNHMEDFAYLLDSKTIDENIDDTLKKAAIDAYDQSNGAITSDSFHSSLLNSYILKLPKAIISSVLSPKIFFPLALTYKAVKNPPVSGSTSTAKGLMKELSNLFFNIVKSLFWRFIKEFWGYVKKDLLNFIKNIAEQILLNKVKRYKAIVLALMSILTRALQSNIASCAEIFNIVLQTITMALNKSVKIPIPGLLLVLSEELPGFSADRAYMNAIERLEAAGIDTGPIYGSTNTLPSVVKGIIDAYSGEVDENSYVKIALKPVVVASGPGGTLLTPLVEGVGKLM
jgi:hypothetical protein